MGRNFKTLRQPKRSVQTLYVKDRKVWEEARRRARDFDDSLSEYVEYALRFFNRGGNFDGEQK